MLILMFPFIFIKNTREIKLYLYLICRFITDPCLVDIQYQYPVSCQNRRGEVDNSVLTGSLAFSLFCFFLNEDFIFYS